MKNITISAEEIHQSSSKPSHTKQIRQDAGTGGGILIPGPPVGIRRHGCAGHARQSEQSTKVLGKDLVGAACGECLVQSLWDVL